MIEDIKHHLAQYALVDLEKAKRFFKTSENDYAFHDKFLGVSVPNLRKIAKIYNNISFELLQQLIESEYNEERFLALIILVNQYSKNEDKNQKIYDFYLTNIQHINNWNLVDCSAHYIIGRYLFDKSKHFCDQDSETNLKNKNKLFELAESDNLWKQRIAIVATWYFIRKNNFSITFEIAKILINNKHDLIHKAVGWMLREVGERNEGILIDFLNEYHEKMPRTMLRYAIEKFTKDQKSFYIKITKNRFSKYEK